MLERIRSYARSVRHFLKARSPEESRKRSLDLFALLLVAAVAVVKQVAGVTDNHSPFAFYALAVAGAGARGGFEPALVATLASMLAGGLGEPTSWQPRLLFAVEGFSIALVMQAVRSGLHVRDAQLRGADEVIAGLRARDRHARQLDTARRHEWEDYRQAVARAQAAMQEAIDDARRQLAALESLTDPSLNPLGGNAMVTELLERLRGSVGADGAALVRPGPRGAGVVAARGLQPSDGPIDGESRQLALGRVAVVHNDPERVGQLSALRWPDDVGSLLVVPVLHDGRVWSTIEVVSQRSRQVSDWDVALARVAADRLAAVVVQGGVSAARGS